MKAAQRKAATLGQQRPSGHMARPAGAAGGDAADARREAKPIVPAFRPDGSAMDLANVCDADIVWTEIANGLSKITRFNGRYPGAAYSVGQHCVMGADALMNETGDQVLAGYFLLHDAHEAFTGDITRPMVQLIEHYHQLAMPAARRSAASSTIRNAIECAKNAIDRVVFRVAGLAPIEHMPIYARQVAEMDNRMLIAEAYHFFDKVAPACLPSAELRVPRLTGSLKPWGPVKAEIAYLDRLERYLGIVARVS